MKKIMFFFSVFLFLTCQFYGLSSYAWNHSIELGYGYSHDPNHTKYQNNGFMLSGDFFPVWRSPWMLFTITGTLGQWYTNSPHDKNLTTAAASLALRLYPSRADVHCYLPYFLASFGPALLSSRKYGLNTQAKNLTIQSNLGFGMELNRFDVNLRLEHFSNAGLAKPNEGFNILYLLSLGYLF